MTVTITLTITNSTAYIVVDKIEQREKVWTTDLRRELVQVITYVQTCAQNERERLTSERKPVKSA